MRGKRLREETHRETEGKETKSARTEESGWRESDGGGPPVLIRGEGLELRRVLRRERVQWLLFSPDVAYLIVASGGVDPLTAMDLATLRVHVLRLGQSQPDFTWRLVGWQARWCNERGQPARRKLCNF